MISVLKCYNTKDGELSQVTAHIGESNQDRAFFHPFQPQNQKAAPAVVFLPEL